MLGTLRRHAYSWVVRIVLGFITFVFIFWGLGTGMFSLAHPVATINGKRILPEQVDHEATRIRETMQSVYGANAQAVLKNVNLREEALDQIIEQQVVADEARHLGLEVSDQSLVQKIGSERAFQVDGQFDLQQYQDVLRQNGLTPGQYEDSMRAQMIADTLRRMIEDGVNASEGEIRTAYDLRNQRIGLAYLELPWRQFAPKINPTAQQVADFYKSHAENFREPERVKVAFIHYEPLALAAGYTPSDKEIEDFYKTNLKSRFTHPDLVRAQHILIEVPAGASVSEKNAGKARAEDILKKAKSGSDFGALAEKYSDDTGSKHSGGDLGFFSRGQMIKPFEDAAFKMKPGEIELVETNFGYHIVKLNESRPAHVDSLQDARPKIVEELRTQAGARLARESINEDLNAAINNGAKLADIAKKRELELITPPSFAKGESLPGVNSQAHLEQKAFTMEAGQVGTVAGPAPYLIQLIEKTPSRIPPLAEIETKVREAYVRSSAESAARADAKNLIAQIKTPSDFRRIAESNNLTIHNVDPFPRSSGSIPGIGEFPEVTDEAGTVAQLPGVIGRVMEQGGNSYIFEVTSRANPSEEDWKSAKDSFTEDYLAQKRAQAWTRYLENLKTKARITINADMLGSAESSQ